MVLRFSFALVLALAASQTFAQDSLALKEAFSGKTIPLQISPSNLKGEFRAIELVDDGTAARDRIEGYGASASRKAKAMALSHLLLTKFQEIQVDGRRMLICYQATTSQLLNRDSTYLPSTTFRLTLVNLDNAKGFKLAEPEFAVELLHQVKKAETNTFPAFDAARLMAARVRTTSNLKQLAMLHMLFLQDHDEAVPRFASTDSYFRLLQPYSKNATIRQTLNPNGGSVQFNMALSGVHFSQIASPTETVLFYETKTWPDGYRCVAFADGHAKALDKAGWAKASQSLRLKLRKPAR